ncbi:unnamed protein product [Dovyalis caffra]|uniref:ABC1 atypical kinase-like domain-containing protein n=1 Tax=Dovyalis caffra TaxID=77055 RepID=A0AAV1RT00_9ROSI|nr:unnamed protein product [Dovyalis caffra]
MARFLWRRKLERKEWSLVKSKMRSPNNYGKESRKKMCEERETYAKVNMEEEWSSPKRKLPENSTTGTAAFTLYTTTTTDSFPSKITSPIHAVLRSSRAISTIALTVGDYKFSLRNLPVNSDSYYQKLSEVHLRSAKRILKLCEENKGFYVKAGQFVASLKQVPKEYSLILSSLQDQAVPCSFKDIKQVLESNLGLDLKKIFLSFDEQPIAAASIAQVHHAMLKDHQEVAVKVQYPGLERLMKIDITTMSFLSKSVAWGEALEKLSATKEVDDVEFMKEMGINPVKVAKALVEVFAEMIFIHGFVHGDPHPGNILVSPEGPNGFCLDHGIYKQLDDEFRQDYCQLWKAMIIQDSHKIQQLGERLGVGKYAKYFPVIFLGRTINSKAILGKGMSNEEKSSLNQELKSLKVEDIFSFMESLPPDFLTILRTDGLLRSVIRKLGAPQHVRLLAYAKYAICGLSSKSNPESGRFCNESCFLQIKNKCQLSSAPAFSRGTAAAFLDGEASIHAKGIRGAMVARLTPDQKVACSIHVGFNSLNIIPAFAHICKSHNIQSELYTHSNVAIAAMPLPPEKRKPEMIKDVTIPARTRIGLKRINGGVAMIRNKHAPVKPKPDKAKRVTPIVDVVRSLDTEWTDLGSDLSAMTNT